MHKLNRTLISHLPSYEIKLVQFGEGNFLRAFVDYAFHILNETCNTEVGIAVVQPIDRGTLDLLEEQDGLYTLFSKGFSNGKLIEEKYLISNVVKCINPYREYSEYTDLARLDSLEYIVSNTTEAGITYSDTDSFEMSPPSGFPAKLTVLLYKRFEHFEGASDKGLTIIPCELINYNGDTLKYIILQYAKKWRLGESFEKWIEENNSFHNTLVDRIVPGYPKDNLDNYEKELDYKDNLIVNSESFFLWVIEGDERLSSRLPFHKTGLNVKFVKDMQIYRTRKVRILNGAHTSMVPFGLLYGTRTVKETIDDPFAGKFVNDLIFEEIIPTLDLEKSELIEFANAVLDRFRNPFIVHLLSSISINSISKFKVRVLPSLLDFLEKTGNLPLHLCFAFACLIRLYKGELSGKEIELFDDPDVLDYFDDIWKKDEISEIVESVLSQENFWGQELNNISDLREFLIKALQEIEKHGVESAFQILKSKFRHESAY